MQSLGVYDNNAFSSAFGLGVLFPMVVAVLLSMQIFGGKGLRDLGSRFSLKGVHFKWYLISIFFLSYKLCNTVDLLFTIRLTGKHISLFCDLQLYNFDADSIAICHF